MYDAIIVGARCAGSPTAMLLARKGYRVLLLDRARFPKDTISTHIVWQPGVARLKQWGLLDKVIASNCPPIHTVTFDVGEFTLTGTAPPAEGVTEAYAPRRTVLDKILVDAAVEAGAELRQGVSVQELVSDAGRVTGIRGRTGAGSTVAENARIVIGADGVHSLVARNVQASAYRDIPTLACWYYAYWSGVPAAGIEFYPRPGRAIGCIPTNDGRVCIATAWTRKEFGRYRANLERNYLETLELAPGLAERVRAGRREERFYGTGDVPNFFRQPCGPGWALVGDAGYHRDPITAQGISDAFRHAAFLAEAIDEAFSGRRPLEEALGVYQRRRDHEVLPMYEFTCQWAALAPLPPEMQRLLRALRDNQAEANRFVGTMAGTVSIPEFFSQENQGRVVRD
ncbi:MAG TPA: NAD(P)/FAD-dependent oxidoreductase [Methylomirabilota bacterium]|nr:NAD(P)/FAD-dependent oxidoreductase [Methylomirabilota bacterium]